MQRIDSRTSDKVKALCRLRDSAAARREEHAFFAEGLRLCRDLSSTCTLRTLLVTEKALAAHPELAALPGEHLLVGDAVAEKLSDTKAPQGVFALFDLPGQAETVAPGSRCLVLENVQDPANVGALLRSAAAFGVGHVLLCGACADPFSPKALRAGMGTVGRLRLHRTGVGEAAEALRAAGIPLYAAALQNSRPLDQVWPPPGAGVAVLVGNEGNGLTDEALAAADAAVRIPMAGGVESLNAAVAGGVLLWHFREAGT